MSLFVLGLVGPIASGKSVVSEFLASDGFMVEKLSNRLREEAELRGLTPTREILQDLGNELRSQQGNGYLAEWTIEKFKDQGRIICLDGVRNPGEIEVIKGYGGLVIGIDASDEKRLEWYLARAKDRTEDGQAKKDFILADKRDKGEGEENSGQKVAECLRLVDRVIMNDGTVEDLINKVRNILSEVDHE